MQRGQWLRRTGLGLGILVALGCSLFSGASPATEVVSVATAVVYTPTPALIASPTEPVASPGVQICPDLRDVTPPQRVSDDLEGAEGFITALQQFLTQGGDPERVALREQEAVRRADLTGDGGLETVYTLIAVRPEQVIPEGHLVVFSCQAGAITLLYRYEAGEGNGLELIALEDLTEDGVADLVFSQYTCGAHTCWHTPHVWSWEDRDFVDQMESAFQYPYPTYSLEGARLVVVSAGQGSVGAGPQRLMTTTLAWNGNAVAVLQELLAAPTYRYHAFLDGELAFSDGDLALAEAAYRLVIEDDALEPWGALVGVKDERLWFEALSWWRLMILNASAGHAEDMESAYAMIGGLTPAMPGYPVAILAERYRRSYERDGDLQAACAYAVDTDEAAHVLSFLNGFGYANPAYELADLCPSFAFLGE